MKITALLVFYQMLTRVREGPLQEGGKELKKTVENSPDMPKIAEHLACCILIK
jgi:hypothetical protein